MFQFYWPWLALLLPLPFLMRMIAPYSQDRHGRVTPLLRFPNVGRVKEAFTGSHRHGKKGRRFTTMLLSLAWVMLVLALMQPEKVDEFTHVSNEGHDLMLAVDISPSMSAVDFSTKATVYSRLDVTKDVVGNFVRGRHGDRVGLIVFGQSAYLHVPLTLDTGAVARLLNETTPGMAGQATAIGDAIGLAVRTLRERPEGSRVLVLLTDGEDNASSIPPREAAKLAKQYGIRIYTIGVGKQGPVPYPSDFGGFQMVQMPIDEELLKEVASSTGGAYYRATDKDTLEKIYDKIDALEKTEAETEDLLIREPLYQYPLAAALLFLFLTMLGPVFRRVVYGS